MSLSEVVSQLKNLFDEDSLKNEKKLHKSIYNLLNKLKNKEIKLEAALENEKNTKKCKHIERELKVLYAQQKKGRKILQKKL